MPPTLPAFTVLDVLYAAGALLLAVLVTAAVVRRPRRHLAPMISLIVVLVFAIALVTARVDPVLIAALVGSAGVAAARLAAPRRSRQI